MTAAPTMTSEELKTWRHVMGRINQPTAARMLGVSVRSICAWEIGELPVPLAIMYACRWLLDERARRVATVIMTGAGEPPHAEMEVPRRYRWLLAKAPEAGQ
jgi:hypothetical protein